MIIYTEAHSHSCEHNVSTRVIVDNHLDVADPINCQSYFGIADSLKFGTACLGGLLRLYLRLAIIVATQPPELV